MTQEDKERMRIRRAAQKDQEKEQERKDLIEGIVEAVGDKVEQIIAARLNQSSCQHKMSCQDRA